MTEIARNAASGDDARFEDAPVTDRPLRLRALSAEDLAVLSSLLQDAVGRVGDISWMRRKRRLVLLLNRFRWEDAEDARRQGRPFERVRSALSLEGVLSVKGRGVTPGTNDAVIALLAIGFEPGEDGAGRILLHLAGGAELAADVECLDAALADLTKPWESPSARAPDHDA
jgi:hypothetical protein